MRLNIEKIQFSYRNKLVLDNVTFSLNDGEVLVIVGPNGSGKSTILKCIDNILKPQSGCISIDGRDINNFKHREIAKIIGYVPQNNIKGYPATVFDTILLGRKPHIKWTPEKEDLEKVFKVIETLKMEQLALRDINELSGGELQKVIIGRMLAQEPSILLLDEPTSNLDLKHQLEVLELVKEQTNMGISAIIALHDLNLALRYSNKVIMLKRGQIYASGGLEVLTPENIESVYDVRARIIKDNERLLVIPEGSNGNTL